VCSGGGRDFMRVFAEQTWGIPKENVIGTAAEYTYTDGEIVRGERVLGGLDLGPGKPEHIFARTGRLPVFAGGNADVDIEMLSSARFALLINHDAPEHTRLRKIVSRLFTPRAVATLEEKLAVAAREIVRAAAEKDSGNFVDDVAMSLPLQAIADLLGVPEADREKLFHWTNCIMNTDDPDFDSDPTVANAELMGYAYTMAEERRRCPADDIVTRLIEADVDGEAMGDVEFAFFVILLAVAGNETTRNAMTHGMNAFFDNPDQWELFRRERPETAVDEIVRWASPVHCFQRTALTDVELGGVTIREGQRVGLFYSSANYDESVFDKPFEFNVLRNPNPHLAFGGNGPHFCIGANLARMEIKLIFNELADQIPDISKLAEPQRLRSGWINGVKELSVSYRG